MAFDIRPLQRALGALRFTTPLEEEDSNYVERPDGLGQEILDHIMVPTTHRLLLAGRPGAGSPPSCSRSIASPTGTTPSSSARAIGTSISTVSIP